MFGMITLREKSENKPRIFLLKNEMAKVVIQIDVDIIALLKRQKESNLSHSVMEN